MDVYCTQRRNAHFYPNFYLPCCRKRRHMAHVSLFLLIREALRDTDQVEIEAREPGDDVSNSKERGNEDKNEHCGAECNTRP